MESPPTRQTLLLRLRDSGNNVAWNEFAELYTPLIYRYCASRGVAECDIPDVTQETLRAVARAIESFEYDPKRARFRTWLFKVTYSKLANHFNKLKGQPRGTGRTTIQRFIEEQPSPGAERDWDEEYRRQMFHWAADRVRDDFQEATWMAFWGSAVDGKTGNEVARDLGISAGAVYVAKSRVIARLRECIASVTGDLDFPGIVEQES